MKISLVVKAKARKVDPTKKYMNCSALLASSRQEAFDRLRQHPNAANDAAFKTANRVYKNYKETFCA